MLQTSDFGPRTHASDSRRLLVVGCGNPLAGDDSVGLEVVRRLQAGERTSPISTALRSSVRCEFRELPGDVLVLLEWFGQAYVILFVDAVQSGAPAGTLQLIPLPSGEIAPRGLRAVSTHGWGLDEAIRLAQALDRPLPRLMLLGIELQNATPGSPRSPAVDAALEAVVKNFPQVLATLSPNDPT